MDRLSKILGAFDENLTLLSRELNLVSYVEGVKIVLEGEEKGVACGEEVISALLRFAEGGESVDRSRIVYCIELAKEGRVGDIAGILSGVVAVTSRGKQIKCKTVGQKQYVEAIKKNTVVFGVGPAGTGKTYLAVCLAVAAFKSKQVEKIILTRPAVEAGEKLGFLPGDLQTKVDPYLRPLYDALQEMLGAETYAKLMEKGIRLGYHNHHFEFIRLPGTKKTMLETFYDDTDSRCVSAEIDVHWVTRGGGSPVRWIRKVAGRMPVIHFKDFAVIGNNEPAFCEIGEGNLDWPAIIEACRETGVRWYSIEQDALFQNRDIFDSIKISFDNLKAMGVK